MLRTILAPLDGSAFGEQALPLALRLAERDGARIELVLVHEAIPPHLTRGAPVLDPRLDAERRRERAAYLYGVADWLRASTTVPVEATLLDAPAVAPALADRVATTGAELVVMTTHGRGGLGRAWLGSVADEMLRLATAPLLLVRPAATPTRTAAPPAPRSVLVPLDGTPFAEEAIECAIAVCGRAGVRYELVQVVPPEPEEQLREDRAAAERRLAALVDGLRRRGVDADGWTMVDGRPAAVILECATDVRAELIAMATHGRSGVTRLVLGSVASEVLRRATIPILLHRPVEETGPLVRPARVALEPLPTGA